MMAFPRWRLAGPMPGAAQEPSEAPCFLTATRKVRPALLALEQEATVNLALQANCDPNRTPLHLVIVVDASLDHMGDQQLESLLAALRTAVESIHLSQIDYLKVGVVLIADGGARVASFLSNNESQVLGALRVQRASGTECVSCGLAEALRVLRHGRPAGVVREAIFLATLGIGPESCQVVREGADALKAYGALVVTACAGRTCSWPCLTETASSARLAFRSWEWTYVDERIRELVHSTGPAFYPIQAVELEDWLSDYLEYAGGGYPGDVLGNRLRWRFSPWPTEGISLSYRVRSLSCGRYAISQEPPMALVTYNSTFWSKVSRGRVSFPNPVVEVACPGPTQTAPVSATPVPTTASSATASPTGSARPTSTPNLTNEPSPVPTASSGTARGRQAVRYLPALLRQDCPVWLGAYDMALVIDVSGSMMAPPAGLPYATRLQAAAAIGRAIVDNLQPGKDQVAVVVYGDEAMLQVLTPLGECCWAAGQALAQLPKYNGSRMDLGISSAAAQLVGPAGRPEARRSIVVLSDGDLNQTPPQELLAAAATATRAGIVLQIVVLGDEYDSDLLVRATRSPARVLVASRLEGKDRTAVLADAVRCGR